MNYTNLSKVAVNALMRNKMRSFLTMLGIIIGVGSVITMLAIGQGSKKSIQDQVSSMGSNMIFIMPSQQSSGGVKQSNTNSEALTVDDANAISKECPSVSMVSPEVRSSGQAIYANQNTPTTIYGVGEKYIDIRKVDVKSGRMFTDREVKTSAKVCLLGKTVITNLFGSNIDPIGLTVRFGKIPLKVIGVLKEKGQSNFGQDQDDLILSPYTTVQKRILAITYIQTIFTSAVTQDQSDEAVNEITETLRTHHKIKEGADDDFDIRTQAELISTMSSISNVLTILLGAIAGISLLVGGIGIMNIMYVSVTERTREIGLRMSIGARGLDILMQFLMESIMLSVIGGIIGILIGVGASSMVSSIMKWPVVIMPASVVLSFVVCTAIGIFFGWYPARKAANLDPIDALRYE
ncbi:MAG: ABC transporter permease [Bacteroidota bacterium]|nr:ABC transporter permease [Bacteroidota bacterium]